MAGGVQASTLPVSYSFALGFAPTALTPSVAPPGANEPGCELSAAHPYPVILVHGTVENQDDNWQAAAPLLADNGYCVYTFNYGGAAADDPLQGTGDIATSAQELATFVNTVLAETGTSKVDIVGHSQGGMMPRYYINFLGGASKVNALVALAPSNYGTTIDGVQTLLATVATLTGQPDLVNGTVSGTLSAACEACTEQETGSSFLTKLNAEPTVPGVKYTVIESRDDEVVTPYTNAFLPSTSNVTNITVQHQCLTDASDHLELSYDPVALADVLNALDPSDPVPVSCTVVLPLVGI
jgi:triacylglycerol esterase/lipase EstA (alpha/beta hydrolase family)